MRATRTMAVAGLAALGVFASTTAAYAGGGTGGNGFRASGCPGSVLNTYPLKSGTLAHPTARVKVYYSSANGGTNCAVVLDNKAGSHFLRVVIQNVPERPTNSASDYGTFTTYAGAVGIRNTNGKCVWVTATIRDNGRDYDFARWDWGC